MMAIRIFNSLAALPILLVVISLALMPSAVHAAARKADLVIVYKQQRLLKLMSRGDMLRQYPVALGFDPQGPKRQRGDGHPKALTGSTGAIHIAHSTCRCTSITRDLPTLRPRPPFPPTPATTS
jgi:hypothetical protein